MDDIPYGIFHEQFGSNITTGGFIKDEKGLPRIFTQEEAEEYAARCKREHRGLGQDWTARPMPAHVLDYIRQNGGRVDQLEAHYRVAITAPHYGSSVSYTDASSPRDALGKQLKTIRDLPDRGYGSATVTSYNARAMRWESGETTFFRWAEADSPGNFTIKPTRDKRIAGALRATASDPVAEGQAGAHLPRSKPVRRERRWP
jgi:hypothetical protein